MEDYNKYMQQYIEDIRHYLRMPVKDANKDDPIIFEKLVALELNHVVWDDMPPDFSERFEIPSRVDHGVDSVNLGFTETAQAKLYRAASSYINYSHLSNFQTY